MRLARVTRLGSALLLASMSTTLAAQQTRLTQEEVEGVLGVPVTVEERGAGGNSFTSSTPLGSVTIDIIDPAVLRMMMGSAEPVPDIGDTAFFQLAMAQTVVLQVIDGTSAFTLSVSYPMAKPEGITDLKEVAKELALLALEES